MAGFAGQGEPWTASQFSASPGFSDDFQKLLGSVMPDSQPIALQASQHTFSAPQNDSTMDLSPIPKENQTTTSVLSAMEPPILGPSDGNKFGGQHGLLPPSDPTLPVGGGGVGGLSQFTAQVPSYMKATELPTNPFLPQPQHQRTSLGSNPFLDGIAASVAKDGDILASLPPEVKEPFAPTTNIVNPEPQIPQVPDAAPIVSEVTAPIVEETAPFSVPSVVDVPAAPTTEVVPPPVYEEPAPHQREQFVSNELPAGNASTPTPTDTVQQHVHEHVNGTYEPNEDRYTNGNSNGVGTRDHFIQRGRDALREWRSGRNLPAEEPLSSTPPQVSGNSELLQRYAQRMEMLENDLETTKSEITGVTDDCRMAKAEAAKWESLYQELCDKSIEQSREAEQQRIALSSEIAKQYSTTIDELKADNQRYEAMIHSIKEEAQAAAAVGSSVTEYEKKIAELIGENALLKQREASKEQTCDEQVQSLKQEVQMLMERSRLADEHETTIHSLNNEVLQLRQAAPQAGAENYERMLKEKDDLIQSLQSMQHSPDKERDTRQIAELYASVQQSEAELRALNSENERLAEKLQERELNGTNTDDLINERNALKQSLAEMMNGGEAERIAHLETQVVKLTGELAARQGTDSDVDNINALVARNEQLESQLASSQLSDPNYSAIQDYTARLHDANVKEREWFRERERHLTHQNRLERENEQQINKIAELEEQLSELRRKMQTEEVSTTVLRAGEGQAAPSPVAAKAGSDYYVEFSRETDEATGITMNREVRRPLPTPAANVENYVPPQHPENGKMLIRHDLPLSVMVFDAIFSLGGLLPSTRHPRPQVVIGDRFEI
eukprot:TRINITY_DN14742_c0_g2_i1.p1 TRINITY_DN14742_c0_g2~~TRINITY_DN14742_c0_g2_i1.p1  ORF type:complete len:841 (+),score=157.16 TRINITY_DN14742_c0_g2_i1:43-2565(+)